MFHLWHRLGMDGWMDEWVCALATERRPISRKLLDGLKSVRFKLETTFANFHFVGHYLGPIL